ncbi:MAG: bifunctional phosphopantothenoylcysteine decarboxylase/phosphopantothenate--cysteine ligase CoaBC [Rhodospirillales bacterium]|nr:MAG: bifunctional phosphopantothenoylcysteine decarboxylase/phosphopantothenate--cysteine ligase CoaBC [Rhodospirillales bacterium]
MKDIRILLIVAGGIAAYKCPDLVRRLRERGARARCILTSAGAEFVTPLSLAAVSEDKVYTELFSLTDESEMGHIRLSREADLVVVAPATADLLARMAAGMANDLATTALLATDKPVLAAPAMNVRMWEHPATQANLRTLIERGVQVVGPGEGDMACGEWGMGRMAEPLEIVAAIEAVFARRGRLRGVRALVTSGPTWEPIDPVRFIANRSSGRQGHAIAGSLARAGAATTLVTGPTHLADPPAVQVIRIETAREMLAACRESLPVDVAVCAAAVGDWHVSAPAMQKLKKERGGLPTLALEENPDVLATLAAAGNSRPTLVIGFAAETENVVDNAVRKRRSKGCDWILANDVSPDTGTFGGDRTTIHLVTGDGVEDWPRMTKVDVAERLTDRVADALGRPPAQAQ